MWKCCWRSQFLHVDNTAKVYVQPVASTCHVIDNSLPHGSTPPMNGKRQGMYVDNLSTPSSVRRAQLVIALFLAQSEKSRQMGLFEELR